MFKLSFNYLNGKLGVKKDLGFLEILIEIEHSVLLFKINVLRKSYFKFYFKIFRLSNV